MIRAATGTNSWTRVVEAVRDFAPAAHFAVDAVAHFAAEAEAVAHFAGSGQLGPCGHFFSHSAGSQFCVVAAAFFGAAAVESTGTSIEVIRAASTRPAMFSELMELLLLESVVSKIER